MRVVFLINPSKTFFSVNTLVEMFVDLLAGSTFVSSVSEVAEFAVLDTVFVAFAFTYEIESNLHLLCESQRFYLDGLRLAFLRTAFSCHTDSECDLAAKGIKEKKGGSEFTF